MPNEKEVEEGQSEIPSPFNPGENWKLPRLCRTALLPSEARYLGITTNTDKVGPIANLGEELFDTGVTREAARQPNASSVTTASGDVISEMILVYQEGKDERVECNATIKPDYKDYFFASPEHGWQSVTLPNDKEVEEYGWDPKKVKGLIAALQPVCDWHKCDQHETRLDEGAFEENIIEMTVNDKQVVGFEEVENQGTFLIAEDGFFFDPDENGKFTISAHVLNEEKFLRFSSFVIY